MTKCLQPARRRGIEERMSRTVLIVEDDQDLSSVLVDYLYEAGYDPVTAKSAEEAIELLETIVRPCVVLLDYLIPGGGADGFIKALEALADADEFKIVLTTGMQGAKLESDARVVHRLMKPFEMEVLFGVLTQHCGQPIPRLLEGRIAAEDGELCANSKHDRAQK